MSKQQHSTQQEPPSSTTCGRCWHRTDTIVVLVIIAVTVAVFANTLNGPFIYDDTSQIVQNQLIQQNKHIWTALTSDVWAFKGEKEESWSNYWRPTFVLWLMLSYRLLGLDSTVGWHAGNILLHALAAILAYGLLRRLKLVWPLAAAIVLIFVVHPVQVESVAWISGSPNMLSAVGMLGALWLVVSNQQQPQPWKSGAAVLLFALGLMAKETVSLFPLIVLVTTFVLDRAPTASFAQRARRAVQQALPFVPVTVAFFIARYFILGQFFVHAHQSEGPGNVLATLPSVLAFYIRQTLFPYWIGPSYGLRPITYAQADLINVGLPLALTVIVGTMLIAAARGDRVRQIGLALFAATFAPALNIRAFYLEHIVQDRYLYLPLLGVLMVVVPAIAASLAKLFPMSAGRAQLTCLMAALVACGPLTLQPTALANEVYLRLIDQTKVSWQNRAHFFAIAANLMRQIPVNYALSHRAAKRGGAAYRLTLDEAVGVSEEPDVDLFAVGHALTQLATFDPRKLGSVSCDSLVDSPLKRRRKFSKCRQLQ